MMSKMEMRNDLSGHFFKLIKDNERKRVKMTDEDQKAAQSDEVNYFTNSKLVNYFSSLKIWYCELLC